MKHCSAAEMHLVENDVLYIQSKYQITLMMMKIQNYYCHKL